MFFDDNFVVRIYRREPGANTGRREHDLVTLTGIVENAATGVHTSFHGVEELWSALAKDGKNTYQSKNRQT